MYSIRTPEVIILDRVQHDPMAAARLERMMESIQAGQVLHVDDEGLKEIVRARGWANRPMRTGQFRMGCSPAIIFDCFVWDDDGRSPTPEGSTSEAGSGCPARGPLLGIPPWTFRNAAWVLQDQNCVCQPAWEVHCAFGCLHACDYCHVQPYFTIMLDLEKLAERLWEFGETIPWQKLYKFDNQTDTICLEPEYGASEVMVSLFARWPDRYLLLYTKSDNVDHLLNLDHRGHTLISWTVSCETVASRIEKGTPSLERRILAIEKCQKAGYPVRVRLSPICPIRNWRDENRDMIRQLLSRTMPEVISIDVLGWMSIEQMRDGMDVSLFDAEYVAALDRLQAEGFRPKGKHVWPHALRRRILESVVEEIQRCRPGQPVSICMETTDMWRDLGSGIGMTPQDYVCCCGPTSVTGHPLLSLRRGDVGGPPAGTPPGH